METKQPVPKPLIWSDPDRMSGAPCFNGTRVPVKTLFEHLEAGDPLEVFLNDFPPVSREHAQAVLQLALRSVVTGETGPKQAAE